MWKLFDCTAYKYISSGLSLGSNEYAWLFIIHQNIFHPMVIRSLAQEPLWVGFTCYNTPHWKGSKLSAALNGVCAVASHVLSSIQLAHILLAPCKAPWWDPPSEQSSWDIGMPEHSCSTNYRTDNMVCVLSHPQHGLNINLKWLSASVQPLV